MSAKDPEGRSAAPLGADRPIRLTQGRGEYLADRRPAGMLEVAFVRSPFAHARVGTITGAGVTSADLHLKDLPVQGGGQGGRSWPALARDRVRFVGEPVAAVWAEDRYLAEDLADGVSVQWEPLEAEPPEVIFEHEFAAGPVDEALGAAAQVVEGEFQLARQAPLPLETRGVIASWDAPSAQLRVWTSTQVPDIVRRGLCLALDIREAAIHVLAPDVGGGFGLKAHVFPEEIVVAALARRLGRPVRWVEDRRENLLAGTHAHDNWVRVRAAIAANGRISAVDAEVVSDVGAYSVYPFSASLEPLTTSSALFAPYSLDALRVRARAVSSNKCPVGASRGVGTNTAVHVTERMMDEIATRLGLDPLELRRRQALAGLPCTTLSGRALDSGDYGVLLDRLEDAAGYGELRRWQAEKRAGGRMIGVGLALFNEHTGTGRAEYRIRGLSEVPGIDSCRVRVMDDGHVQVGASSVEIGQGLAAACRDVAARELGVDPARVEVLLGDTYRCPPGTGAFVSRGGVGLVDSVVAACREVAEGDLEPGTEVVRTVEPRQVFASGAHLAVVELDRSSSQTRVLRYVAVEDCGTVIDPAAVAGQVRGGVAMGIGKVLLEQSVYSDDGQPLSPSLVDYLVPLAPDVPAIDLVHVESPSPRTLLGSKGVGEAGTIGAFGAVANAVADALAPLGSVPAKLPYTPRRVHEALNENRRSGWPK